MWCQHDSHKENVNCCLTSTFLIWWQYDWTTNLDRLLNESCADLAVLYLNNNSSFFLWEKGKKNDNVNVPTDDACPLPHPRCPITRQPQKTHVTMIFWHYSLSASAIYGHRSLTLYRFSLVCGGHMADLLLGGGTVGSMCHLSAWHIHGVIFNNLFTIKLFMLFYRTTMLIQPITRWATSNQTFGPSVADESERVKNLRITDRNTCVRSK